MSVTEKLFVPLLSAPAKPLVTQYDDADGSRVELSRATVANWAAKTANWLAEECDVEPGGTVAVALPAHWQTLGVLLGAWWCGASVTLSADAAAQVVLLTPEGTTPGGDLVATVALDPLGMGLRGGAPSGTVDYLSEIKVYGDTFRPWQPLPGDAPALDGYTVDELVTEAQARAKSLAPDARILSTMDWSTPDDLLTGLLAPLAAGASLVQVAHPDPAKLAARAEAERTTVTLPPLST